MRQLMGILGWIVNLRQLKASNSNMLLDAQMMTLAKLISHF